MLAVGFDDQNCGANNRVVILQNITRLRKWNKTECSTVSDHCTSSVTDPVHDLAFAPRLGRSYDLLAVATKDIKLYVLCQIMYVFQINLFIIIVHCMLLKTESYH